MSHPERDFSCPNCGAELAAGVQFCRHCGGSEESGWGDDWQDEYGRQEDDDFDYDEFVRNEFPEQAIHRVPSRRRALTRIVALLLIIVLAWSAMRISWW